MNLVDRVLDRISENDKVAVDVLSASAVTAAILNYVPAATAVLSLIWVCLRIWETETVKKWTNRL